MTSNLLQDRVDAASFETVLDEFAPDVVVTQELGFSCADVLAERYPHHHLQPAEGFPGRGIASRFDAEFGDIAMPQRWATTAGLTVGDQPWQLVGVHLVNPIDFPWWRSVADRRAQLDALDTWLDDHADLPTIVAGDFNATPIWPAYRRVNSRGVDLVAAWSAGSGQRPQVTWGWRPGWPRMLRIDHVFGRGLIARDVTVVPIRGSDHAAVVVDLAAGE